MNKQRKVLVTTTYNEMGIIIDTKAEEVAQPEPQWILCSERLPEEKEWIGTKRFGTKKSDKVHVTLEGPDGSRFVYTMSFENGGVPRAEQRFIDAFFPGAIPIAWMPFPEPYKEDDKGNR